MKTANKLLIVRQLDKKLEKLDPVRQISTPEQGWLKTVRKSLSISLRQLGERLEITPQSVQELERREKEGTITLNTLREAGAALDMQLVYGFIPLGETLEKRIEKRAYKLASKIVKRTSTTMRLEDQENSEERLQQAIAEMAADIMKELPSKLWD